MKHPLISIIVPIYNAEKYLRHCIESILAQSFRNFELLLINDGSKDNSGWICDEYVAKDSRVHVYHIINGGASKARLLGVNNAKGEWITFVDSDDSIRQDYLYLLYFSSNKSVDVVVANTNQNKIISGEEWVRLLLVCKIRCEVWSVLYRRSLFNKMRVPIPSTIVLGEDFLLNLQYGLICNKVRLIPDNIYYYTQNIETSITNSYKSTLKHEEELLKCLDNILEEKEELFAFEKFRKKYLILERLIFIGEKPYDQEWVKALMFEKKKFKETFGIKEIILLSVPFALLNRLILKVGLFIKAHI